MVWQFWQLVENQFYQFKKSQQAAISRLLIYSKIISFKAIIVMVANLLCGFYSQLRRLNLIECCAVDSAKIIAQQIISYPKELHNKSDFRPRLRRRSTWIMNSIYPITVGADGNLRWGILALWVGGLYYIYDNKIPNFKNSVDMKMIFN